MIRLSTMADQLLHVLRRFAGTDMSGADLDAVSHFDVETTKLQGLTALLSCGLGHQVAIDSGNASLRIRSGKGKVARESMWLPRAGSLAGSNSVLLYGSVVPTKLEGSRPF